MVRLLVLLLLTLSTGITSVAGAHVVDLCQDEQSCSDLKQTAQSQQEHDCSCPAHHNSCSHHPIYNGRSPIAVSQPSPPRPAYWALTLLFAPSPWLEGPFQPPKI
ncbi:MAG: hypothetical protein KF799_13370 [Bdellovibrionales bacterium]|nr:hypothetical protein [Bdellovibrionales bacterium]